jgi:hypothetical protein
MTSGGNGAGDAGRGGDPGQAGSNGRYGISGGAPGASVIGNSFITWATVGDRRGPLN